MSIVLKGTEQIFKNAPKEAKTKKSKSSSEYKKMMKIEEEKKKRFEEDKKKFYSTVSKIEKIIKPKPKPKPKPQKVVFNKKIKLFGKNVKYSNIPQLANNLNIGYDVKSRRENAKLAIKNASIRKVIYDNITGDFDELKLSDKPLLIRKFTGIKRVTKAVRDAVLTNDDVLDIDVNNNDITIKNNDNKFKNDDIINVHWTAKIRIVVSDQDGTLERQSQRKVSGVYRGFIEDTDYTNLRHIIMKTIIKSKIKYTYNPVMTEYSIKYGRFFHKAVEIDINDKSPFIKAICNKILKLYKNVADYLIIESVKVLNSTKQSEFNLKTMKLKLSNNSNITNIYNEIIDIDNDDNENCVISYLSNKYKALSVKKYFIKNVPDYEDNGISTDDIYNFCKRYDIKMIAYDILGTCIKKYNIPADKKKALGRGAKASLIYIAYNNHIYPIKNKLLNKVTLTDLKEVRTTSKNIQNKFQELIKQNITPTNISISKIEIDEDKLLISSFIHDKTLYYTNDDYETCYEILKLFDIDDKMTPYINRFNIMNLLETLYDIKDTKSFFPTLQYNHGLRLNYVTDDKELLKREKEFKTIDKNKAYPHALYELDFIQSIDIRKTDAIIKPDNIDKSYMYIARPKESSLLMPDTGFYSGEDLEYAQAEGLKFELLEGYQCDTQENPFKNMIKDYYDKTAKLGKKNADIKNLIKLIMNVWIGKFDKGCDDIKIINKVDKLCNNDEARLSNGNIIKYDDHNNIVYRETKKFDIYTRLPIKYQLLNRSRRVIYEKMKELKLCDSDIIQIKTDSITFVHNDIKLNNLNLDNDDFKAWKKDEYNGIQSDMDYTGDVINMKEYKSHHKSYLFLGYAGCGKTYKIINSVIPKIEGSYIVLSPSHSSIEDYRLNNINCNVIQAYQYSGDIPEEETVIIDEIGLCDTKANNIIYKCMLSNKKVICYGDYNQLDPVADVHCNSDTYLNYAYRKQLKITSNHRNKFTIKYYDDLINSNIDLEAEIKKYSSPLDEAEFIICPTNSDPNTGCDKYNKIVMNNKKITMYDNGCLVMCKTNKLRNIGLYNNFICNVVDTDDEYVHLKDKTQTYKVSIKQYEAFFKPAYARTLYNCQGKTFKSFHVPDECISAFIQNGKQAYTLISRLKQ